MPNALLMAGRRYSRMAMCVTTETRHLDRLGQVGEFEQFEFLSPRPPPVEAPSAPLQR